MKLEYWRYILIQRASFKDKRQSTFAKAAEDEEWKKTKGTIIT
jgi:hypothetical protein